MKRKSEYAQKMDRRPSQIVCNNCQQRGHISRFCPEGTCEQCHSSGHAKRDCPQQFRLNQFRLWLPYAANARIGVSDTALREMPGVGPNLQIMRGAAPKTVKGHLFCTEFNSLIVQYGGHGSILIALQDANSEAETLIAIRTHRQDNVSQAHIKIAARYTLVGGQLIENINRLATGERHQQSPTADTHVLIYVEDMMEMTAVLELNLHRYYMEWGQRTVNQQNRAEVYVFTDRVYGYRAANERRSLIQDGWIYFRGHPNPERIREAQNAARDRREIEDEQNEEGAIAAVVPQIAAEAHIDEAVAVEHNREPVNNEEAVRVEGDAIEQQMVRENEAEIEPELADLLEERFADPIRAPLRWYQLVSEESSDSDNNNLQIAE